MRYIPALVIILLSTLSVKAQHFDWASDSENPAGDRSFDIAADDEGNVYTCGSFRGTLKIQTVSLVSTDLAGNEDGWVAKFDPEGHIMWGLAFNGPGFQSAISIAVDRSTGEVYVSGHYTDSITIGSFLLTNGDFSDAFLARISTDGIVSWAYTIESKLGSSIPLDIALDKNGNNVFVSLFADDSLDLIFHHSRGQLVKSPGGSCLVKYLKSGTYVWSKVLHSNDYATVNSIAIDTKGNIYATGEFNAAISWESSGLTLVPSGTSDIYVIKFGMAGVIKWIDQLGGAGTDNVPFLDVDASNNVYVTGLFNQQISIGSFTLNPSGNPLNIFLAKISKKHVYSWAQQMYSPQAPRLSDLSVSDAGSAYVFGKFEDTLYFAGSKLAEATPGNGKEIFTAKFNPQGGGDWGKTINASNEYSLFGRGLEVLTEDLVSVCGAFTGTAFFDSISLSSGNGNDFFIAEIKECPALDFKIVADTTVLCVDDTLQISIPYYAGYTYNWYVNGLPDTSNNDSPVFNVSIEGEYNCVITSPDDCLYYSDSITVTHVMCSPKLTAYLPLNPIVIYPDPATDELTIEVPGTMQTKFIQLINTDGKPAISKDLPPGVSTLTLSVRELPPGIYLVRITDNSNRLFESKVIILR